MSNTLKLFVNILTNAHRVRGQEREDLRAANFGALAAQGRPSNNNEYKDIKYIYILVTLHINPIVFIPAA